MKSLVVMQVFKDRHLIEAKQFEGPQIVIGRSPDSELRLNAEDVSDIHCIVECRDSGYYICDLGSSTGTIKNGSSVLDEPLVSGDEIHIGPYKIIFRLGAPKPKIAPPVVKEKDLLDQLRYGKGSVVEVILAWKERVLTTYHYTKTGLVRLGSDSKFEINMPDGLCPQGWPLIEVGAETRIAIAPGMKVELCTAGGKKSFQELLDKGKAQVSGRASILKLEEGEIQVISFSDSDLQLYVRFVPEPPAILIPPWIFNSSELTGIVVSLILLYVYTTQPVAQIIEQKEEIPARLIFARPNPKKTPKTPKTPQKIEVANAGASSGKASQGGAIKQAKMRASNARSKEAKQVGLLSTLLTGGMSHKISKAYNGAGGILGDAAKATGNAGFNEDRPGAGLGRFKSSGPGAYGTTTAGIGGLGTKSGRGSGYGSGKGLGTKTSVAISTEVGEENFIGSIDREAVRRVILKGLREIRGCYERELSKINKTQNLEGKVVIEWTIADHGQALGVKVKSSTLGNPAVENCVRDRLANWQFPDPPVGGVAEVNYPFYFRAEN